MKEGTATPPFDRITRSVLAIAAVAGLTLAFASAATGSALLASVSAVASATAAMIVIVAARRLAPRPESPKQPLRPSPLERTRPVPPCAPRPVSTGAPQSPIRSSAPALPSDTETATTVTPPDLDFLWPKSPEPEVLAQAMFDNLGRIGTSVAAHLWLFDPATDTLRLMAVAGPLPPAALPVALPGTLLGRAVTTDTEVLAPLDRGPFDASDGSTWRFAIPLGAGEVRGVAAVDFRSEAEPDRAILLRAVPALQSSAVGALALYVSRQETAAARVLFEAARDLTRLLSPDDVVSTMLDRGMALSDASTGSIMLLNPETDRLAIAVSKGLPQGVAESVTVARGEGVAGWVLASGKPLVVEDLPARTTHTPRHGVRTAISVPIADEEGMIGVLNVGSKTFAARFSNHTLATLEALGTMGAVALRNARAAQVSADLYFDTLKTLALALETKDPFAHGGTERVVGCAVALGHAMGLDQSEARALEIAALLHDIGMIATGDASGVRQRPLTTVEWGLLKMHPVIAAELLEQAPTLRNVAPIVYHHHEYYDGGGYASGLAGEAIPLAARILAVADAYVAMTSDRPYRKSMTHEAALAELTEKAGTQFDPHVVRAFRDLVHAQSAGRSVWCA